MAGNEMLNRAAAQKNDEFYTQMDDIVAELRHYRKHFRGKIVLCNCDDPYESNFFKYFALNFNKFGLKKLIATCYATSPIMYTQLSLFDEGESFGIRQERKKPYKIEITEVRDENDDGAVDLTDIELLLKSDKNVLSILNGDGEEGVYGYGENLNIRPAYQRELVYEGKDKAAVIGSVIKGYPIGVMYWMDNGNGTYKLLDGQQRTLSICRYVDGEFPVEAEGSTKFFDNLTPETKEKILNYRLTVYFCTGTVEERLEWFQTINIARKALTDHLPCEDEEPAMGHPV